MGSALTGSVPRGTWRATPAEQLAGQLDEAEQLLTHRARLAGFTRQLRGPRKDVRTALSELHRLVER